jgi:hypothetical protein
MLRGGRNYVIPSDLVSNHGDQEHLGRTGMTADHESPRVDAARRGALAEHRARRRVS